MTRVENWFEFTLRKLQISRFSWKTKIGRWDHTRPVSTAAWQRSPLFCPMLCSSSSAAGRLAPWALGSVVPALGSGFGESCALRHSSSGYNLAVVQNSALNVGFLSIFSGPERGRTPGWWSGSSLRFLSVLGPGVKVVGEIHAVQGLSHSQSSLRAGTTSSGHCCIFSARHGVCTGESSVDVQFKDRWALLLGCSWWNFKLLLMSLLPLHPHPLGLTWWRCASENGPPGSSCLRPANY